MTPVASFPSCNVNSQRLIIAQTHHDDPFVAEQEPTQASISHPLSPMKSDQYSIEMVFRGDAEEIDSASLKRTMAQTTTDSPPSPPKTVERCDTNPTTQAMHELRTGNQNLSNPEQRSQDCAQPEQSSSQLTDILNGVSPSKVDFWEFRTNCPSAVPSPLHRVPGQPHPVPMGRNRPPPVATVPIHDHFFMTNEHIDVVSCALHDFVEYRSKETIASVASKHDQLLLHIGQQFEDLKIQMNSVNGKVDRNANQSHNTTVQLEKLLGFIKSEVMALVNVQTKKILDVERGLQELQKGVHELQKSSQQKNSSPASYSTPHDMQVYSLPIHHSQPSLASFYNSNEPGREPVPRLPPGGIPEPRRHGNPSWPRPTYVREDKVNQPISGTNPYNTSTQFGGGLVGGFQQYGYLGITNLPYGYEPNMSK